jgi:hypothetical protein
LKLVASIELFVVTYKLQLFEQLLKQLIHSLIIKLPVYSDAVNVEVPSQLFTTPWAGLLQGGNA